MGIFNELMSRSPYQQIVIVHVIAVVIVVVKYHLYWARKFKRFSFFEKTNTLVLLTDNEPNALQLYFKEKEIRDVSVTRIALWNSGTLSITSNDISDTHPISIALRNIAQESILDCTVEYISNPGDYRKGKEFPLVKKEGENHYSLTFNQIKKNDGIIIQLVHTGDSKNLLLDFHVDGVRGTIEVDKQNRIKSVNGKTPLLRFIWFKFLDFIGFRTDWPYSVVILLEMLFLGWYVVLYGLLPLPKVSVLLVLYIFFDILIFTAFKLLLQRIPDKLKKEL